MPSKHSYHTMTLRSSRTNANELNKQHIRGELQDNVVQKQSVREWCASSPCWVEYCDCYRKGMWRRVAAGRCPCVRVLVSSGADVNAARTDNGCTPVFIAAEKGHLEVVRALVSSGADVNSARTTDGATPVFMAAQNGHLEVVRVLVSSGADVNAARTDNGCTPVFIVAEKGHLEVVLALVVNE